MSKIFFTFIFKFSIMNRIATIWDKSTTLFLRVFLNLIPIFTLTLFSMKIVRGFQERNAERITLGLILVIFSVQMLTKQYRSIKAGDWDWVFKTPPFNFGMSQTGWLAEARNRYIVYGLVALLFVLIVILSLNQ